jgi:hypothetical protein
MSSIFNSIIALRALEKTQIVYLFVATKDLEIFFPPKKVGELYNLMNYNKLWLRILNKEESYKLIDEFANLLDSKITKKEKEKIWKFSGGHAWYIKVLTKLFAEDQITIKTSQEELAQMSSMKARAMHIWESLHGRYRELIQQLALTKKRGDKEIPEYLTATDLIQTNKEKITFFSPLFGLFIQKQALADGHSKIEKSSEGKKSDKGLAINFRKRIICKDGKSLDSNFTRNEFKLLKYFFENEELVVTRDDIAEVLWGKDAAKKYSEWAIDKVISRIREKTEETSRKPKYLITLRGVGFKFQSGI